MNDVYRISDPDLIQVYYNKVIDSIQARIADLNYSDDVLLLVDLEYTGNDVNDDAIVSIGALVGNQQIITLHNDEWWYGELYGMCNGSYSPQDGAQQLEARVTDEMLPEPPIGMKWYFINPHYRYIIPTQDPLPGAIDNYLDYRVFYATEGGGLSIGYTEKCMSMYEMNFYEDHYVDYAIELEDDYNQKFMQCVIRGNPYTTPQPYHIQHDYEIWVGKRYCIQE